MMGSFWYFVSVDSSGIESIPLRTGDVRDRMRLWTWNSLPPDARRMSSLSGGFYIPWPL